MHQPAALAFMRGDDSPEVLAELRARMLRWSAQRAAAQPLNRMLALGTERATRLHLRDAMLVDASALLLGTRWQRCVQLAAMACAMNARRYSVWVSFGIPQTASEAERLVFLARDYGEPLPESGEAYLSILPGPS